MSPVPQSSQYRADKQNIRTMPQSPVSPLIGLQTEEKTAKWPFYIFFGFKVCTTRTSSFQFTTRQTIRIKIRINNENNFMPLSCPSAAGPAEYLHNTRYHKYTLVTLKISCTYLDMGIESVGHQFKLPIRWNEGYCSVVLESTKFICFNAATGIPIGLIC